MVTTLSSKIAVVVGVHALRIVRRFDAAHHVLLNILNELGDFN